jgi:alkyl hydroperoxide reductase subunit F
MLTNEIIETLKSYTASMQKAVTFVLQTGIHDKREELLNFLNGIAGVAWNSGTCLQSCAARSAFCWKPMV